MFVYNCLIIIFKSIVMYECYMISYVNLDYEFLSRESIIILLDLHVYILGHCTNLGGDY